jgi:hypothetical protein
MSVSSSGAITTTGVISGSNALSASYAVNATSASYAATSSYASAFNVDGTLTATTLVVQTITSSVDFVTGSTRFGSILGNTHVFSGSVTMNPNGLFVSSSGNVGIGTTNPGGSLEVYNSQNAATILRLNNPSTGTSAQANVQLGNYSSSNAAGFTLFGSNFTNSGLYLKDGLYIYNNRLVGGITIATEQLTDIILATNAAERLRIKSTGNVGVGINTPNARLSLGTGIGTKFLVYDGSTTAQGGNGYFAGFALDTPNSGDFTMLSTNTGALVFGKFTNNNDTSSITENMRITNGGNVGIGTSNPLSSLTVVKYSDGGRGGEISIVNTAGSTGTEAALNFGFGNSSYNGDNGNAQIKAVFTGGNEVTDMVFTTWTGASFTEKMRIMGSGYVGIGTTSPAVSLHVNGLIYATKGGSTNNIPGFQVRTGGGGPRIQTYGLDADSQAWMGLGTDMAGNPYEHSMYFSAPTGTYGRQTFGSYDGTTYSLKMTILRDGSIGAPTGTNIYNPSDVRLKQNVITITDGLDKIMGLNPVKFNWVEGFSPDEQGKDMLGFIAQEVQNIVPEAVEDFSDGSSIIVGESIIENPLRVNEKFIIPVLVKAIQELKAENDTLKEILQRNNIQ